jgi:hypothetical protein
MRHRIPAIVVMLLAIIGLSAPVASAASGLAQPHALVADSCSPGHVYGPYHLEPGSNQATALSYHGPGNLATVSTLRQGDTNLMCVRSSGIFNILNDARNCVRMTDQSNDYQVMEEVACANDNANYEFQQITVNNGFQFVNVHFGKYLGTESCPSSDGDVVEGVGTGGGTCITWLKVSV